MTLSYDMPLYPNFSTYIKPFQNLKVMKHSPIKIAIPIFLKTGQPFYTKVFKGP